MVIYIRRVALFFLLLMLPPIYANADTVVLDGIEYTEVRVLEGSSMYYFKDAVSGRVISVNKALVESGQAQIVREGETVSSPEKNGVVTVETEETLHEALDAGDAQVETPSEAVDSPEGIEAIETEEEDPRTSENELPTDTQLPSSGLGQFAPASWGFTVQKPKRPPRRSLPRENTEFENEVWVPQTAQVIETQTPKQIQSVSFTEDTGVLEPEEDAPEISLSEGPLNTQIEAFEPAHFTTLTPIAQKSTEPQRQAAPVKISPMEPEERIPPAKVPQHSTFRPPPTSGILQSAPASWELKVQKPNEPPRVTVRKETREHVPEGEAPQVSQPKERPPNLQATFIEGAKDPIFEDRQIFDGMEFVWIPPGTFAMGSPSSEKFRRDDERQHEVTISKGFWLGKYEVTQQEWESVMDYNPSLFMGSQNPVEQVSWQDCQEFIQRLNNRGDREYRLPTEAEWEYACRAGSARDYSFGTSPVLLSEFAWIGENSEDETHPVGQKMPNPWGLYDMYGNLWEFCQDWKGDYSRGTVIDPTGPDRGSRHVRRGGSWLGPSFSYRSALRGSAAPQTSDDRTGFRLLLQEVP